VFKLLIKITAKDQDRVTTPVTI